MKISLMAMLALAALTLQSGVSVASDAKSGALYEELKRMDHAVFENAFVDCNAQRFRELFTEDAEFYHDVTGATFGKDVWTLKGCPANDGVRRERVEESLAVFPINGYGAIQTGEHWFIEEGATTSTLAKFIHLWHKTGGEWRISRVLSFDHQSVPGPGRSATTTMELRRIVMPLDAVVFDAGYNQCDIDKLATVIADDLEFYHDQGGPMYGKQLFLDSMENGICKLDYKARRELVEDSLEVFPLYDQGELYGLIENGVHRFHATYPGKPEHPTGIAKFTLLWLLEDGAWKLSRALSFDHAGLD